MYGIDKQQKTNLISKLYDVAPDLHEVHSITTSKSFIKIIKKLGIKYPTIGTNVTLRLDRPNDKKLSTSLHQDIWYSMISNNSLTIWFNLSKVNEIDGPLEICKTFKKKIYKFSDNKMGTFTAKIKNKYKFDQIYLKEDEILVFSQYLLHKSGKNLSDKPRASIQIRYNDFYDNKKFNKSYKSVLSSHVLNNQKKYLI
jgi:ectoine hydroxylase-related dioxygenase (phytanoyl-CoA dioxygenase family)